MYSSEPCDLREIFTFHVGFNICKNVSLSRVRDIEAQGLWGG